VDRIEFELLQCPNCGGEIDQELRCTKCGVQFQYDSGIYNLLPGHLDEVKGNENSVFADNSDEVRRTEARPWRRIIHRQSVLRFDHEIVDLFQAGRFLELGGETCYSSAIFNRSTQTRSFMDRMSHQMPCETQPFQSVISSPSDRTFLLH